MPKIESSNNDLLGWAKLGVALIAIATAGKVGIFVGKNSEPAVYKNFKHDLQGDLNGDLILEDSEVPFSLDKNRDGKYSDEELEAGLGRAVGLNQYAQRLFQSSQNLRNEVQKIEQKKIVKCQY